MILFRHNKLILLLLLLCNISVLTGQNISGIVRDFSTGEPLPQIVVSNLKLKKTAYTNANGFYSIRGEIGDTLSFSSLGFKTKKKVVTEEEMNVSLVFDLIELGSVELVAKPNINDIDMRKAVGSVVKAPMQKIKERPSVNVLEALQGQIPGLSIKTSGELGKQTRVRIRGNSTLPIKKKGKLTNEEAELLDNRANQPLYVLDGQTITQAAFETLNPNDIKEIKVLKDAAANALYGVKAANGVIEITSKRGINGPIQYSFSVHNGATFRGNPRIKVMDTEEKLEFERLSKNINTPGYNLSEDYYREYHKSDPNINELISRGKIKLDSIRQIHTNWFEELTRIDSYQSYNLSARGGNDKNKFYVSGGFFKQGGKFEGNNLKRYTGKLNYEVYFTPKIYVMFNSGLGIAESNTPNGANFSVSEIVYRLNPYEQKEKGELVSYPGRTFKDLTHQFHKNNKTNTFNFSTNIFVKFSNSLYLSSVLGTNYLSEESLSVVPPNAFSEINSGRAQEERGRAVENININKSYSTNTRLNYDTSLGKHQFSFSGNMDYNLNTQNFIGISGYGLPEKLQSGAGINNNLTGFEKSVTSSRNVSDALLGFGLSGLYQWDKKIDIYGSYKTDGSSLLPSDKRWNTFWATGIGYTLSNENFMKRSSFIHLLKIRASYGITASLSGITPSLAVPTFSYGENAYLGIRDFSLVNLYNKDLRPEQNTSYNIGVDVGLFHKLNLNIEAYKRITDDLLLTVPIPPSNGFSQQLKNVGVLQNSGIEISLNTPIVKTDNFEWRFSGNLSYNQNKVINLYEGDALYLSGNPYPDYKEGEPSDLIYGLILLGIFPADGLPRFRRADGTEFDGNKEKPNPEDFIVLGYSTPPYSGGIYQSIQYKNWFLSCDLYYTLGGKAKYENTSKITESNDSYRNLIKGQLAETWFKPGDVEKIYPTLFHGTGNIYENWAYASTKNTGRTDFVRINNITLRYEFDYKNLEKWSVSYLKNASLYAQLKNVVTFSNFGGADPESANLVGSAQPVITLGVNLSF